MIMITIRQALKSDIEQICTIGKNVPEFSVSDETTSFWPQEIIENIIHSDEAVLLVAAENAEISGFIIANCNKTFKKVIIENICVTPNTRNSGIGEQLLSTLSLLVEKNGYEYISTLIPTEAHGASKLYTNSGFTRGKVFQWLDKTLSSSFKSK
jgi:ribosomal protein S18 acetylase RimI-like enzyme